jgi:hypothetical protein
MAAERSLQPRQSAMRSIDPCPTAPAMDDRGEDDAAFSPLRHRTSAAVTICDPLTRHSMPLPCIPGGRYSHTRAEASDAYCLLECPAGENARGARLVPVRSRPVRNWITPETNTKPTGARQSASGMDHPFRVRAGPVYPLAGCTIRCTIRGAGPQASAADWIGLGADRRDARGPRHPARFVCVHGQHA